MQRRHLLLSSALLSSVARPASAVAAASAAASASGPTALANAKGDPAGAVALAQSLGSWPTTSQQLVRDALKRIDVVDRHGPRLNSMIELNPDALAIARGLDAERAAGRLRGPLHGLPVVVKDNIASADRMSTTAGSLALEGVHAVRDASLVTRLRTAGAVIIGKTNLSEWANIRSTRSTSGWSGRGGLTRNPYALDRNTSGSSSGSAAAVAAGIVALGVGTETDGSIVSPASITGLVGFKPSLGRISRSGVIPIAASQDTAGPMTRSVADAALLYAAMAGRDPADAETANAPDPLPSDGVWPTRAFDGARLGVARAYFTGFDEADALIEQAIVKLRELGAEIVDPIDLPAVTYNDAELLVLLYELKAGLADWLHTFAPDAKVQTLADVIAFNAAHRPREMALFGQELFDRAQALGGLDTPAYLSARAECVKGARDDGIDRVLRTHRLDALIAPTGGLAWLTDPIAGDHSGASFSTPAAVAGYPHLTVPAGFVRGLPLGISFVGPRWSDWRVLAFGHAYEQATLHRRAPSFLARSVPAFL